MKNNGKVQAEQEQEHYHPTHFPENQYQNQYPPQQPHPQGRGGGNFRGREGGGFGIAERGQIICYIYVQLGHYVRDCHEPRNTCSYCKVHDHNMEQCPQLIVKWKAQIIEGPNLMQNSNPNPNVHMIFAEKREPSVAVIT